MLLRWAMPVLLLASLAAGVLTRPLRVAIEPAPTDLRLVEGAGQAVLIGVLGGVRALVADVLWLRGNYYWQEKNIGLTETTLRTVTRLQPGYEYFWLETARIVTYDMPVWRFGRNFNIPRTVERAIRVQQAERGLEILREAEQFLPDSALLAAEQARIVWMILQDDLEASRLYRVAFERTGNRRLLYARFAAIALVQAGLPEEADVWLRQVLAAFNPADDPLQFETTRAYHEEVIALLAGEAIPGEPEQRGAAPN